MEAGLEEELICRSGCGKIRKFMQRACPDSLGTPNNVCGPAKQLVVVGPAAVVWAEVPVETDGAAEGRPNPRDRKWPYT